ncbi:MAG: GIY-YIG nuclease family protein [Rhodopila sp.]|jgi:hypothetical protein
MQAAIIARAARAEARSAARRAEAQKRRAAIETAVAARIAARQGILLRRRNKKLNRTPEQVQPTVADNRARIYIIGSGRTDHFKVGWCFGNVRLRLQQLQTGNPNKLFIEREWVYEPSSPVTGDADTPRPSIGSRRARVAEIERTIHAKLRHQKVRGEWFCGTLPDLIGAVESTLRDAAHEATYAGEQEQIADELNAQLNESRDRAT